MKRAGITGDLIRKAKGEAGHNLSGLTFHSLRHTFISVMANGGVAEELRKEIVGQTTGAVHKVYTHHEAERLRSAITSIPSILQACVPPSDYPGGGFATVMADEGGCYGLVHHQGLAGRAPENGTVRMRASDSLWETAID